MDENPYKSPLPVDEPTRQRKSFAPKVYWGDVIAWFTIGAVLAALILSPASHPGPRYAEVGFRTVLGVWFLIGGLLVWFAMRRGRQQR